MNRVTKISPNRSRVLNPKGIVLHHTAGSYAGSVAWCLNPKAKVSYHAIVNLNGDMTILVPDNSQAWANGVSSFKGRKNCNGFLLSIAVSGDTSKRELTEQEIKSVAQWCVEKMDQYNFGLDMITTHREISPGRKNDVDTRAEQAVKDRIRQIIGLTVSQPNQLKHTVVSGNTLSGIARQYNTTVQRIRDLNRLTSDVIRIGQVLIVG